MAGPRDESEKEKEEGDQHANRRQGGKENKLSVMRERGHPAAVILVLARTALPSLSHSNRRDH